MTLITAAPSSDDEVAQLRSQLAIQQETIRRLKMDMEALNMKYVSEIEHAAETLYEKDRVEQELEELSCRLFEQANEMVAQEKREKQVLEHQLIIFQESHLPPISNQHLDEFRLFVSATASSRNTTTPTDLKRMVHHHEFLKVALEQDVEPCLKRFGVRLSRRLMDHFVRQQSCTIERVNTITSLHHEPLSPTFPLISTHTPILPSSSSLWDRFLLTTATTATVEGCAACGQTTEPLLYRYRLDTNEEWQYIDQHCRDRLVAVCEFYAFLRNIYLGLYIDQRVDVMYQESVRLRLQMFYARMGARLELSGIQRQQSLHGLAPQEHHHHHHNNNNSSNSNSNSNLDNHDTRSVSTVSSSSSAGPPHTPIQSSPLQENDKHQSYNDHP